MTAQLVDRMAGFGETIFAEMTQRALRTGAVNLGQGFPDHDGPPEVLRAAQEAIAGGWNQYPPGAGHAVLREAVAAHQERFHGITLDPATQVLATTGATEGIAASVLALVEPGDEVVMLEPYYDSYAATVALAGGVRRTVPLRFPDHRLDADALRAAVTPRTKVILLNTPHNPTGVVLTPDELAVVADVAREHDLVVVVDEVYEHLVLDEDRRHVPLATLTGMAERTLSISSGGKTFATTGWKVGWVTGPAELVDAVRTVKQFMTFATGGPFQPAIAAGLGLPDAYFDELRTTMRRRRDLLVDGLRSAGLEVSVPQGGYFVIADVAPLGVDDATAFCRELPDRAGVVGVPVNAFTDDPALAPTQVRFAFCKRQDVIAEGVERLQRLRPRA